MPLADPPSKSDPSQNAPTPNDFEYEDEVGTVIAVMGEAVRKGPWEPPARLRVFAVMGGVELDFREATLLEGETVVEILAVMGGVNIIVPPDIDVHTSGMGFLGGFGSVSHHATEPGAPILHIKGLAFMGGVEVKVQKPSLRQRFLGR